MQVLLTTLSTFGPNATHYYKDFVNSEKYCSGIYQQEAGTKAFLANEKIDYILALSSYETYHNGSSEYLNRVMDLSEFIPDNAEQSSMNKGSELLYYANKISAYIQNQPDMKSTGKITIEEKRKLVLQSIVNDIMRSLHYEDKGEWFIKYCNYVSCKSNKPLIENAISKDIKSEFAQPDDYNQYINASTIPVIFSNARNVEIGAAFQEYSDTIETIKNDRNMSFLSKELCLLTEQRKFEKRYFALKEKEQNEIYKEEISSLIKIISKLNNEIQAFKNNRQQEETAYAKWYLFSLLDNKYLMKCLAENQKTKILFLHVGDDIESNIYTIISKLEELGKNDFIKLSIDAQGGSRTNQYVLNGILSILNNSQTSNISINKIIGVDFERGKYVNDIKDFTENYRVSDLISGMNAFMNYGKADQIQKSIIYSNNDTAAKEIIDLMDKIDDTLSVCNMTKFEEYVVTINQKLKKYDNSNGFFTILRDRFSMDYRPVLTEDETRVDFCGLLEWAINKGFIQQALTIIESKAPEELFSKGYIVAFSNSVEREACVNAIANAGALSWPKEEYQLHSPWHYIFRKVLFKGDNLKSQSDICDNIASCKAIETKEGICVSSFRSNISSNDLLDMFSLYNNVRNFRNGSNHGNSEQGTNKALVTETMKKFLIWLKENKINAVSTDSSNRPAITTAELKAAIKKVKRTNHSH